MKIFKEQPYEQFSIKDEYYNSLFDISKKTILLIFTDNYVSQVINLILSIQKYNKDYSIICLSDYLSKKSIDSLLNIESASIAIGIATLGIPEEMVQRYNKIVLFRLFAPYFIDDYVKRILYIDSDILCINQLNDSFYGTDKIFAMVPDLYNNCKSVKYKEECSYYCNSGVMIINKTALCSAYTFDFLYGKLLSSVQNYSFPDQDFINIMFGKNDISFLPLSMNFQVDLFGRSKLYSLFKNELIFLHFTSGKPWEGNADLKALMLYLKYSPYSVVKKLAIKKTLAVFFKKILKVFLRPLRLCFRFLRRYIITKK